MRRTINLLHIVREYKFYKPVSKDYEKSSYYNNLYLFYQQKDYNKEYLKFENVKEVTIADSSRFVLEFIDKNKVDAVFFHSVSVVDWKLISKIPSNVVIIWWAWGYELYSKYGVLQPFININQYKKYTSEYLAYDNNMLKVAKECIKSIARFTKSLYYANYKIKALKNINYIKTVTNVEFSVLHSISSLSHMRNFHGPVDLSSRINPLTIAFKKPGIILIGNSASATNNHLDIIYKINLLNISDRKIIVPLSYGDTKYKVFLKNTIRNNPEISLNIEYLESFLDVDEYNNLFTRVSHAVFGVIRQQAMGNIRLCLLNGVKIFLFRESIAYKELKNKGYVVFSIEEDLNMAELSQPLSKEEAIYNCNLKYDNLREENNLSIETAKEILNTL